MTLGFGPRTGSWVLCALVVGGCGGGGGDSAPAGSAGTTLTAVQQNVQDAFSAAGGSYTLTMSLPLSGSPATYNYAFATQYTLTAALSATSQVAPQSVTPISTTMGLPSFSTTWYPTRTLVGGNFVLGRLADAGIERLRLSGNEVVDDFVGADGSTVYASVRVTSFQGYPLSGGFASAPAEVCNAPGLAALSSNTSLLKPNPTFIAGSMYFKRQSVRNGDTLFVPDCTGPTRNVDAVPCAVATTIESMFPHTYGGTTYNLADGTIQTLQGLRAWISNAPIPAAASSTTASLVLFERQGNVYRGQLQRDGAAIMFIQADGTTANYSLRFNQQAIDSLKAAVAF